MQKIGILGSGNVSQAPGATADAADRMNEFIQMISDGKADFPGRTKESTTPTSIEVFARIFKWVYENV